MNLGIKRVENLPFQTILVPLSVFFAISGNQEIVVTELQRNKLLRWFWRASFARRYSSGVLRHLEDDIKHMLQLKGGQQSALGEFTFSISEAFFLENSFGIRNVNSKTVILLLAQQSPKSFISGTPVDLNQKLKDYNKSEFHHLMPRSYLKSCDDIKNNPNCLANICFLSRSENKKLGGVKPSVYRKKMAVNDVEVLESALCPISLFDDDYDKFVTERTQLLKIAAETVTK
jgi:hypothetical protein